MSKIIVVRLFESDSNKALNIYNNHIFGLTKLSYRGA